MGIHDVATIIESEVDRIEDALAHIEEALEAAEQLHSDGVGIAQRARGYWMTEIDQALNQPRYVVYSARSTLEELKELIRKEQNTDGTEPVG